MTTPITEILYINDRSGSMAPRRDDVIGGFNAFVEEQKAVEGEARLTYVQFDHDYDMVYRSVPLERVASLTKDTYTPRGSTALLDAIGRATADMKEYLMTRSEEDRKRTKVIVVIFTDGVENESKEFSKEQVKVLVDEMEADHGWDYLFLGAGMGAISQAGNLGVKGGKFQGFDLEDNEAYSKGIAMASKGIARGRQQTNRAVASGQCLESATSMAVYSLEDVDEEAAPLVVSAGVNTDDSE